jgi:hypothetical protein
LDHPGAGTCPRVRRGSNFNYGLMRKMFSMKASEILCAGRVDTTRAEVVYVGLLNEII